MKCEYCGREGQTCIVFQEKGKCGWKNFCNDMCFQMWKDNSTGKTTVDELAICIKPGDIITLPRIKGVKGMKKRKNRTFVVTHVSR